MLEGKGQAQYNGQTAFKAIKHWCEHVHLLTKELCQLQSSDRTSEALTRLAAFHELTDALFEQVNLLVQQSKIKV